MTDLLEFSRRVRKRTRLAAMFFFGGALMLLVDFTTRFPTAQKGEFAVVWIAAMVVGAVAYCRSLELPVREIMQLASSHEGILTLTEISTQLEISPDLAMRTLRYLQQRNLARPSLQMVEKNLWEFPDCLKLPLDRAAELAQRQEGKLTLEQLMATGVSLEDAERTMEVLRARGMISE